MKKIALALALSGACLATGAQAVIIDDFNGGVQNGIGQVGVFPTPNVAYAGAVGGSRTLAIAPNLGTGAGTSAIVDGTGALAVGNPPGSGSITTVTWNSNGAGLGGGAGTDLVQGVNDALQLNVLTIDVGQISVELAVTESAAAGGTTGTMTLAGLVAGSQAFLFTGFSNHASIDFTKIASIVMTITAGLNSDFSVDVILTRQGTDVPDPGTLALFGAGLIGAAMRRRKTAA